MAEDVVFGPGTSDGEVQVLVAGIPIQVAVCRTVGNQKVNAGWNLNRSFQIRTRWNTEEVDAIIIHSFRFQQNDATRNHVSGPDGICIENTYALAVDEHLISE